MRIYLWIQAITDITFLLGYRYFAYGGSTIVAVFPKDIVEFVFFNLFSHC